MIFDYSTRTRRFVAAALAAGLLGGGAAGIAVAAQPASDAPQPTMTAKTKTSTVPKALTRPETAAEDVIGFLEKGKPAKSKAVARILRDLAHGKAAAALRRAGVPPAQIQVFQRRADRTATLSLSGARVLAVSQTANSVSQLMPGLYGRFFDPVPASVLKLDFLDRQVQLDSQAGQKAKLRATVRALDATWQQLRPQLVKAGGTQVARAYDTHVSALKAGGAPPRRRSRRRTASTSSIRRRRSSSASSRDVSGAARLAAGRSPCSVLAGRGRSRGATRSSVEQPTGEADCGRDDDDPGEPGLEVESEQADVDEHEVAGDERQRYEERDGNRHRA